MPSFVLNNVTAPDNQPVSVATPQGSLIVGPSILDLLPVCSHVNIDVYNAAIYWSVKEARVPWGLEMQGDWNVYVFMTPGSRTIYTRGAGIIGFKFYAAITAASLPTGGTQAAVTAECVQ